MDGRERVGREVGVMDGMKRCDPACDVSRGERCRFLKGGNERDGQERADGRIGSFGVLFASVKPLDSEGDMEVLDV